MSKMKLLAIAFLTIFLVGCPFVKTEYEIRTVPVPVVVFSEVEPPEIDDEPHLPIYDLNDESTDEEIVIAIEESVILLEAYNQQLHEALAPYREAWLRNRETSDALVQQAVSRIEQALKELSDQPQVEQ